MTSASQSPEPLFYEKLPFEQKDFDYLREVVHRHFGIHLTERKMSLVESRLQKYIRKMGLNSFGAYVEMLRDNPDIPALSDLVNLISTNHSFFYREPEHFAFLRTQALPEITTRPDVRANHDLRIWCAASSSGEEPYTIQIETLEFLKGNYANWKAGILATDISEKVLTLARLGRYTNDRIDSVPEPLRKRYFRKISPEEWEASDALRKEICFRRFNLMTQPFPFKKRFHIVFCRNVMIYFDRPTREALVQRIFESMEPGGFFMIGHSETLDRNTSTFQFVKPAIYRKPL